MAQAIGLGRRGLGRTWPNPAVGCVLAKDGRVLANGWTQEGGRPHAERMALEQAGAAASGGTAYVSLEPCAHQGRTPPCAGALIEAGIARVVVGQRDPNPRVDGAGIKALEAAGIEVAVGVLEPEARRLHRGFIQRIERGRPWVCLKLATSLDSKTATAAGESKWITSPEARARGHWLRATHDAVLVGIGTVLADDPALTCRLPGLEARSPVRVVVDGKGRLPAASRLASSAREVPTWLVTDRSKENAAWADLGVERIRIDPDRAGRLPLQGVLSALAERGITRLLVEGGAGIATALLAADLVDEAHWFRAPLLIGGDGLSAVGPLGAGALADTRRFHHMDEARLGPDGWQRLERVRA